MNLTPEVAVQLVMSLGVIPGLFVWLLFDTRSEHKKEKEESRKREDALMEHIKKSDETQSAIMKSTEQISASQQSMQNNMSLMQRDIEDLKKREC